MTLVRTEDDYRQLLAGLDKASAAKRTVAVDTETSGLRVYLTDVVRGISVAFNNGAGIESWYLPVTHPDSRNFLPGPLVDTLNEHQGLQAYHHADFDWAALRRLDDAFVIPEGRFHDTQVASWLFDENMSHTLKDLSAMYFGEDAKAEQRHIRELKKGRKRSDIYAELRQQEEWLRNPDGSRRPAAEARAEAARLSDASKKDWDTFTADDLEAYASRDAELTLMLMDAQVGPYGSDSPALKRELALQPVLYRMIRRGVRVNPEKAERQGQEAQARMNELGKQFEGINLKSTPQVRKLVYEDWGLPVKHRTDSGDPSTSREALEELEGHPGIRELMEYRRLLKAMGTYYGPLLETIGEDGRIHAAFSSTRTVTGRLSCSDPNLMTIPRGDTLVGVRDVFEAEPGYELWEYDLVSAELFVQADFCGDPNLIQALRDGEDLHKVTATLVWGPDFTPIQRRYAKNLNYGFSYGIGPKKFANYMVAGTPQAVESCAFWEWNRWSHERRPRRCGVCHVCQASDILDRYREAYPDLVQLMKGLEGIAKRDGFLPLHVEGRYRHFKSPRTLVPYYTALNAVVQGGVAETMKDVMLQAEPLLDALGARLCLQVHDSLVIEVPPGAGPVVHKALQQVLDDVSPLETLRLLFDASPWDAHD
jgi:DNA polymerase I-like protein with 3'-5' exonuclease and polymerase domains